MLAFQRLLFCIFPIPSVLAAAVSKSASGSAQNARAHAKSSAANSWGPFDLGLGSAGDLPSPQADTSDMIAVPGEGMVMDEMVALKRPDPWNQHSTQRSQVFLSAKPQKPLAALATAQSQGFFSGDSLASASVEAASVPAAPVPAAQKGKVMEEYDVSGDEGEDDDYRTTKTEEMKTKEEVERQARGDVENVKPEQLQKPRPLVRKLKLAAAVQQQSQVVAKTAATVEEQQPGGGKMMAQCMTFAGWVKSQGSTGPDLVRIWKGTCMPGVLAGNAPPAYGNMCNALGTAVSKFAVRPFNPAELCQAVLAVFKESGVGATPL